MPLAVGFAFHSRSVSLTLPEKLLVFTAIPALLALPHPSGSMENGSSSGKDAQGPTDLPQLSSFSIYFPLLYFPSPEIVVFEYFFQCYGYLVGRKGAADLFSLPVVLLFLLSMGVQCPTTYCFCIFFSILSWKTSQSVENKHLCRFTNC